MEVTVTPNKFAVRMYNQNRKEILRAIGTYLDMSRANASREIIPNVTGTRNPYHARKKQPSTPGKLTERTGNLQQMLEDDMGAAWKVTANTARKKTSALEGLVKIESGKNTKLERYVGTLRVNVTDAALSKAKTFTSKLYNVLENRRSKIVFRETKQKLFMRFKHETGLRGEKRQFLAPGARKALDPLQRRVSAIITLRNTKLT